MLILPLLIDFVKKNKEMYISPDTQVDIVVRTVSIICGTNNPTVDPEGDPAGAPARLYM